MHPINVRQSNISLVGNDCKDFTQLPLRCTSQPGNRQQAHHCSKGGQYNPNSIILHSRAVKKVCLWLLGAQVQLLH